MGAPPPMLGAAHSDWRPARANGRETRGYRDAVPLPPLPRPARVQKRPEGVRPRRARGGGGGARRGRRDAASCCFGVCVVCLTGAGGACRRARTGTACATRACSRTSARRGRRGRERSRARRPVPVRAGRADGRARRCASAFDAWVEGKGRGGRRGGGVLARRPRARPRARARLPVVRRAVRRLRRVRRAGLRPVRAQLLRPVRGALRVAREGTGTWPSTARSTTPSPVVLPPPRRAGRARAAARGERMRSFLAGVRERTGGWCARRWSRPWWRAASTSAWRRRPPPAPPPPPSRRAAAA